ncbi:cytosolic protein [Anaerobacillus alkalidiazotrophicus]|uniref:Cytosolic protein n=1 Tax=Anaerobacillus alkalidiazotrophicus TaxID=472963 RepID=A0A1S2M8X0_9BACI|nr:cytosolic protein [Anaerobacillus alkalidiazotrophicus]OIJ21222.1 cytosolic protein [Anaerobacillus alkalidiazotrophicus]
MYVGRDMTELSMMSKKEWTDKELAYFHRSLQQVVPYLNAEGVTIHREIVKEIMSRGSMSQEDEASYEHGSRVHFE